MKAMKTFTCILVVVLAVSLTACDNGTDDKIPYAAGITDVTNSSVSPAYEEETKPNSENTEPEHEPTYIKNLINVSLNIIIIENNKSEPLSDRHDRS